MRRFDLAGDGNAGGIVSEIGFDQRRFVRIAMGRYAEPPMRNAFRREGDPIDKRQVIAGGFLSLWPCSPWMALV
jgi:hypothetical protein